jgi:hypothetical protein
MGTFLLGCEFDIVRRIGWSDEELGEHIDTVFDRLHQADGVKGVEAEADLDSGRTVMSMTITTFDDDPRHMACAVLGVAIRSCGGTHVGLLPMGEEAIVRSQRNQWSGLRTPTWRIRQVNFDDESAT